jgi:hypothetical protein
MAKLKVAKAEDGLDFRLISAALAVFCLVLAGYVFLSGGGVRTVYVNNTVYPSENLSVSYLYPLRCVNCDLNKPGQCDYCNSYYDLRVMDMLSQEVGVPVRFYVSDTVERPNVLVAYNGKMALGDGRSRFNIANTLCRFAGVKKSCELYSSEVAKVRTCVAKYGLSVNSLVYHRSSGNCPTCSKTDAIVDELRKLSYDESVKYDVYSVDRSDSAQAGFMSACLQVFDSVDYVPQLVCPGNGRDLTGQFTLAQAQEFADQCIEAKL